jgi:hypothetical protein
MKFKRWTTEEDDFLRANCQTMSARAIGEVVGRKPGAVRARACFMRLGIKYFREKRAEKKKEVAPPTTFARGEFFDITERNEATARIKACVAHAKDLEKYHSHGIPSYIEKPTKGGPRFYTPEPRVPYNSPAAALVEG